MGKNKPKPVQIFFNHDECKAIGLALGGFLEDMKERKTLDELPWTPDARRAQKEMHAAAISAAAKLEKFAGIKCELPPYEEGDENEFYTKPS